MASLEDDYVPELDLKLVIGYSIPLLGALAYGHAVLAISAIRYLGGDERNSLLLLLACAFALLIADIIAIAFGVVVRNLLTISIDDGTISYCSALGRHKTLSLKEVKKVVPNPPGHKLIAEKGSLSVYPTLYKKRDKNELLNLIAKLRGSEI